MPSRTETVTQIPPGVTTAGLRFRYTGGNNWYWVIDGVRLSQS